MRTPFSMSFSSSLRKQKKWCSDDMTFSLSSSLLSLSLSLSLSPSQELEKVTTELNTLSADIQDLSKTKGTAPLSEEGKVKDSYSFIYLFIYLFIHLFIYLFIIL